MQGATEPILNALPGAASPLPHSHLAGRSDAATIVPGGRSAPRARSTWSHTSRRRLALAPDAPKEAQLLLTLPDGPLRHNKALYDKGHPAVRPSYGPSVLGPAPLARSTTSTTACVRVCRPWRR